MENLKKQSQIIRDMNKTFSDLKKAEVISAQQIAEYNPFQLENQNNWVKT